MTASGPGPHIPVSIPEPQAPPRRRRGLRRRVARWWGERSPRTRVVAGLASFAVVAGGASYPGTTLLIPARNSGPLEYDASAGICMAQVPVGRVITLGEGWVRNRSGQDIDILDVDVHEAEGMEVIGAYLLPVLGDTAFGSAPNLPPAGPTARLGAGDDVACRPAGRRTALADRARSPHHRRRRARGGDQRSLSLRLV